MVQIAWTSPMTFTANQALTASQLNTHLRDNMAETMPGKAVNVGGVFVCAGPFNIAERNLKTARVDATVTTDSTSYTDLTTVGGPTVTVTTGSSAWVQVYCRSSNSLADRGNLMSYAISGAFSRDAMDARATLSRATVANDVQRLAFVDFVTDLTPGENTFTSMYRVTQGTGTFSDRFIGVFPL